MDNQDDVLEFDLMAPKKGERTGLLTTACVLSWIWGGLAVLGSGFMMLLKSFFFETVMKEAYADMDKLQRAQIDLVAENFNNIFLFGLVAYIISIIAVIMMYKLKKIGFYIYAPLHALIIAFPYLTYSPFEFNFGFVFSLLIYGAFLMFYGTNLKHMD